MLTPSLLFFSFLAILGFELRALQLLGKLLFEPCPVLFALVIFFYSGLSLCQAGLDHDPSIFIFHVAGMTGKNHHTPSFYLLRWDRQNFLSRLASDFHPPNHLLEYLEHPATLSSLPNSLLILCRAA
jgi:hypothetical protein